jgi:hypothetical protein
LYEDIGTTDPAIDPLVRIVAIFLEGGPIGRIVEVLANQTKYCRSDMAIDNLEEDVISVV